MSRKTYVPGTYMRGPQQGRAKILEDALKLCVVCGDYWLLQAFQVDRQRPDGRRNECKACVSERRKDHRKDKRDARRESRARAPSGEPALRAREGRF